MRDYNELLKDSLVKNENQIIYWTEVEPTSIMSVSKACYCYCNFSKHFGYLRKRYFWQTLNCLRVVFIYKARNLFLHFSLIDILCCLHNNSICENKTSYR